MSVRVALSYGVIFGNGNSTILRQTSRYGSFVERFACIRQTCRDSTYLREGSPIVDNPITCNISGVINRKINFFYLSFSPIEDSKGLSTGTQSIIVA